MGEMADYYLSQEDPFEADETYWRGGKPNPEDGDGPPLTQRPPRPTKTIWITKTGERIAVRDMGDSHLVNTIRMLRRKAPVMMTATKISLYAPDGAYDRASSALMEMEDCDPEEFLENTVETYPALLAEAKRRKLQI